MVLWDISSNTNMQSITLIQKLPTIEIIPNNGNQKTITTKGLTWINQITNETEVKNGKEKLKDQTKTNK